MAILEYEAAMATPDFPTTPVDAYIWVRATGTTNKYLVVRGRAAGTGDNNAWGGQLDCPLGLNGSSHLSLDYEVIAPAFDGGCTLRLIGYWA